MAKRSGTSRGAGTALLLGLVALGAAGCGKSSKKETPPPPVDPWPAAVAKAQTLLASLTLDQKLALLVGQNKATDDTHRSAGYLPAITTDSTTLVPAQYLCDGPNGVGNGNTGVTQFPTAISVASSWDTDLAARYGAAAGDEWRRKGCHYALAPGMNTIRVPYGGRSAEYYSEDPYLASRIAVATVKGIQDQGVIATLKHYAANDQEIARNSADVVASERTLREITLVPFEASIAEAHAGAVMCSYNRLNGTYACENPWLLETVLRGDWGFQGVVMTDWTAAKGTVSGVKAGLDLEMGSSTYYTPAALNAALTAGTITTAEIDAMVLHQLSALYLVDGIAKVPAQPEADVSHPDMALELAQKSAVLLRNVNQALPLDPGDTALKIAVIGGAADAYAQTAMPGSGFVIPAGAVVAARQGIEGRLGRSITYSRGSLGTGTLPIVSAADDTFFFVDFSTFTAGPVTLPKTADVKTTSLGATDGFAVTYLDGNGDVVETATALNVSFGGDTLFPAYHYYHSWPQVDPADPRSPTIDFSSVEFKGFLTPAEAGRYTFGLTVRGRAELQVDGASVGVVDQRWLDEARTFPAVDLTAGEHEIVVRLDTADWARETVGTFGPRAPAVTLGWEADELEAAVAAAAAADVAIVVVSDKETEETDHIATLPGNQDELVSKVAAVAKKTIVVVDSGSGLVLPWAEKVDAIVEGWYGGQRSGEAIAGILFGDVNPSGRTVVTFPFSMDQWYAQQQSQYPGATLPGDDHITTSYDEGVFVGYRWFDQTQQSPRYPFGHGLSYTQFAYSSLGLSASEGDGSSVEVTVTVKNVGARAGSEVAQLYVGFPSWAGEPPRQLKGFQKVALEAGASAQVKFQLDKRSFSYWDESTGGWVVPKGAFELLVGSSSRDIRGTRTYTVTGG